MAWSKKFGYRLDRTAMQKYTYGHSQIIFATYRSRDQGPSSQNRNTFFEYLAMASFSHESEARDRFAMVENPPYANDLGFF